LRFVDNVGELEAGALKAFNDERRRFATQISLLAICKDAQRVELGLIKQGHHSDHRDFSSVQGGVVRSLSSCSTMSCFIDVSR
jgi:hypothetical protein